MFFILLYYIIITQSMKIVLFVLFALGCFYINSHASSLEGKASNEVEMTVKYHDPTAGNNDMPRGPVEIPQVFIDSYTFTISSATILEASPVSTSQTIRCCRNAATTHGAGCAIHPHRRSMHLATSRRSTLAAATLDMNTSRSSVW